MDILETFFTTHTVLARREGLRPPAIEHISKLLKAVMDLFGGSLDRHGGRNEKASGRAAAESRLPTSTRNPAVSLARVPGRSPRLPAVPAYLGVPVLVLVLVPETLHPDGAGAAVSPTCVEHRATPAPRHGRDWADDAYPRAGTQHRPKCRFRAGKRLPDSAPVHLLRRTASQPIPQWCQIVGLLLAPVLGRSNFCFPHL